jgi:hypothetical protein
MFLRKKPPRLAKKCIHLQPGGMTVKDSRSYLEQMGILILQERDDYFEVRLPVGWNYSESTERWVRDEQGRLRISEPLEKDEHGLRIWPLLK